MSFLGLGVIIMRLKYEFETVDLGDEVVAVPVGDNASEVQGVIKLNSPGADIFNLLKNETTEEAIIQTLTEKYDDEQETIARYVHKVLQSLCKNGIIDG